MIQLQPRDKALIRICHEQQFLLKEHVKTFFPAGTSDNVHLKRTRELVRAGYLKKRFSPVHGSDCLIVPTKVGQAIAVDEGAPRIRPAKFFPVATLFHDALVTSVRIRLEQLWDAKFICERAIKESKYPVIPDGMFCFKSGNTIALEVENSEKGKDRFLRLANRWSLVEGVVAVLYVAREVKLATRLRNMLEVASKTIPLCVIDWPSLKDGTPKVWTVRGEVPLFDRREF